MSDSISDLIIAISAVIGALIIKLLSGKMRPIWRFITGMGSAIVLSVILHLAVKWCSAIF